MEKESIWNEAGKAGAVLGVVCIVYSVLNSLLGNVESGSKLIGVLVALGNGVLWLAKFFACIYLFRFFLKKHSDKNPEVDNAGTFKYGMLVALLSALICSAYDFVDIKFLHPNAVSKVTDALRSAGTLTSAQLDEMDALTPKLPTIVFFTRLVWCWLFGTFLASIFSRNIPSRNPFERENKQ